MRIGRNPVTGGDVRTAEDPLRRWYLLAADQERHPPPLRLTNTDGDPVAPTTLTFELRCKADEAFAALRSLDMTASSEKALPADAECDAQQRLSAFRVDWTKRGNRLHGDWDNTILGHLEVSGAILTASVNSSRRASRLRKQIENRLGDRVLFQRTVIESTDALLARARKDGPQPAPSPGPPPGIVAEFERAHWEAWVDQPIPALKNQTPREAARTPEGRERLEALLAEFAWRGNVPVQRLRERLALIP